MNNKDTFISYMTYIGATADEAHDAYTDIINRISAGESVYNILKEKDLESSLADLF